MAAPDLLIELVDRFRTNHDRYSRADYKEAHVRQEFIDPMFELLGWDMANRQGYAEQYKEVVHEDALRIGKATKAPDYSFRIGGVRKFFLEAKKPSVRLKDDIPAAFQVRRYAWSAGLPLSILTDFEEFAVYDCRIEPHRHDKAAVARVMYFTYEEYAGKWEELVGIFSKEAILKGSFDRYAESTKKKRGTAEVDDAFLAEIEEWREMLARDIALRNPALSVREVNHAVQVTIDRIIFLRIAEDRGAEPYGQLQALKKGKNVYRRLVDLYHHADNRYNSGLFHFSKEKGREETPDEWTPALRIEDGTLQEIFRRLYYPDSPYEFSVLPGSILGQVYERFLGNVIRLDENRKVTVEAKPDVRKAGGVFYTPEYITKAIVRETVGRAIEGKKPEEITDLRILDPACGSGSFLLTAYDFLLDWHLHFYTADNPGKFTRGKHPKIYEIVSSDPDSPPAYRLTTNHKKEILLNNIFGVDIDAQAVEVTKLSLLLRVLEDENQGTLEAQLSIAERVLPNLERNIKCGNSLIGPEFYDSEQMSLLDEETIYRINTFDWQKEFPDIFASGGFDVVVGNPPYIRIQHMKEWAPLEVEYYKTAYRSAAKGNYDIYVVFVEKGLELLRKGGTLGYILPHKFFNARYGETLRELIAEGSHLRKVVHFGDAQIFDGATTYTCLLFLTREPNIDFIYEKVDDLDTWRLAQESGPIRTDGEGSEEGRIDEEEVSAGEWNFVIGPGRDLFRKLSDMPVKLGEISEIFVGLQTSADDVFVLSDRHNIEQEILKPFIVPDKLVPYSYPAIRHWMLFPYKVNSSRAELIPSDELKKDYRHAWQYLKSQESVLRARERGKWDREGWHAFGRSQNLTKMEKEKLIIQVTAQRRTVIYDDRSLHMTGGGSGPFYGIRPRGEDISIKYLLGILNSSVFDLFVKQQSTELRGGYFKYSKQYIENAPVPLADSEHAVQLETHVETMLDLHKRLAAIRTGHDKTMLERQIEATDRLIDRLVCELYELSEREIAVVEMVNQ